MWYKEGCGSLLSQKHRTSLPTLYEKWSHFSIAKILKEEYPLKTLRHLAVSCAKSNEVIILSIVADTIEFLSLKWSCLLVKACSNRKNYL